MQHKNNFDLLRLFAAGQVMFEHSIVSFGLDIPAWARKLIDAFPGVAIFFVISGFLVSQSYLKTGMTKPVFFDHRRRRIYPALWINLIVILALLFAADCIRDKSVIKHALWILTTFVTGSDWLGAAVAGGIVKPGFYVAFPSGVLWTIPVELGFYLLVPVIFSKSFESRERIGISILTWAIPSLVIYFIWSKTGHPLSIPKYLWIFLMGATINLYWDKIGRLFFGKALFWVPLFLLVIFTVNQPFNFGTASVMSVACLMLLACTTVSIAFTFENASAWLKDRDISYGVYLWHMPIILTMTGFGLVGSWKWLLTAAAATCAVASASWFFVERPVLRRKQKTRPLDVPAS